MDDKEVSGGRIPDSAVSRRGAPANFTALPPPAYTDFFLPLLSRCPSAMGIKNKDGETPGQILGWGPPWDSAEEEDEASREHEWRQKLQGELEDEWQELIGRLEGEESIPTTAALPCRPLFLHPSLCAIPLLWPYDLLMTSPHQKLHKD